MTEFSDLIVHHLYDIDVNIELNQRILQKKRKLYHRTSKITPEKLHHTPYLCELIISIRQNSTFTFAILINCNLISDYIRDVLQLCVFCPP